MAEIDTKNVAWLMRAFAKAFKENCAKHGTDKVRIFEMLNALALEAASIVTAPPDENEREELYQWFRDVFVTAVTMDHEEDEEGTGRWNEH